MSAPVTTGGWALALVAVAGNVLQWRAACERMERLARATHELRRPLAAARLAVDAAGRGVSEGQRGLTALKPWAGEAGAAVSEARWVRAIDAELRRAVLALADLDAARTGRKARERREPLDLAEVVDELGRTWGRFARALGRELRVEAPPGRMRVHADRDRLVQACGNLLANALEHGSGPVTMRARPSGGNVRIEVSDAGPGLPAPVATLTSAARGGRGSRGRGLAIAAEIAGRHGGRLAAAPTLRGARIALELPVAGEPLR